MRIRIAAMAMLLVGCTGTELATPGPVTPPAGTEAPITAEASPPAPPTVSPTGAGRSPAPTVSPTGALRTPAPTASGTTGQTGCSTVSIAGDSGPLTGVWDVDDEGLYYLRQMGDCVWWFGTSLREVGEGNQFGFANVAVGRISGDLLHLEWADVPLGGILGGGTLTLEIVEGGDELRKITETGTGFGGITWTRRVAGGASPSPDPSPT